MIMKKDVNFGLFILIIATLISFAGFTTYYQNTFENISSDYEEKITELEKVTGDLQLQKSRLNETSYELKIKVDREAELSGKYDAVKSEKDKLKQDKEKLTNELEKTEIELSQTKVTLTSTKNQLAQTESDLTNAEDDIEDLEDDVGALCTEVNSLGTTDLDIIDICD